MSGWHRAFGLAVALAVPAGLVGAAAQTTPTTPPAASELPERVLLTDIGSLALIAVATPLVAVLFGLPPIVAGLLQDPVDVLREAAA